MSVPEGGVAADDLAGLPARGSGELPEQGSLTTTRPVLSCTVVTVIKYIVLKQIAHSLSYLFLAPGSHVAAVCYQNNGGHSVCGGVRQAHRWLHGAVSERSDSAAESRYDSLSTWPAAVKLTHHYHHPPLALSQGRSWPDCTKPSSSHAQCHREKNPVSSLSLFPLGVSVALFSSVLYIHSRDGHSIR